ncbi:MAG: lysophospholipase [Gammaproteobacteria bacterium]|nr:lysophospholipase [Gammaproteobacteria bacterium]
MSKHWPWIVIILLAGALWASTPPRLEYTPLDPGLPPAGLIPGTEERITATGARTEWVVVALHGFSATRQETAPLAERVAQQLDANLVEARLSGHGHVERPLDGVRAEHWLADAERVLQRARELGNRLIVIGTSTGATLAAAVLDQDIADRIDTLVMISPNFEPRDWKAQWVTRPAGPLLARIIAGETRCFETDNAAQARYWSTCYPMAATTEVMRLVNRANRLLPARISQRLLLIYSSKDQVVSPEAMLRVFNATTSPQKEAVEIADAEDPSHHVIAGDIMSPGTTERVVEAIVLFIRRPAP